MLKTKKYDNGLTLVVKYMPNLLSVSAGIFVGVGSADENDNNNGISHFIEHMVFKGTSAISKTSIIDYFKNYGSQVNAYTSKELTCFNVISTKEHFENSFKLLADVFINREFMSADIENEKLIVLEEISMIEDTPHEVCFELLAKAYYAKHPLNKAILGCRENIINFERNSILDFFEKYYFPANIVISIAGCLSFEEAEKIVDSSLNSKFNKSNSLIERYSVNSPSYQSLKRFKNFEQVHLSLGWQGDKFAGADSYNLTLISNLLGGGMGSKLYERIREENGLAYSVFSNYNTYRNDGLFFIYAAVNPVNACQVKDLIINELNEFIIKKITHDEFIKAKEQLKSSMILAQENTYNVMDFNGKSLILSGQLKTAQERIKIIDSLSIDGINETLENYFKDKAFAEAMVGKNI